MGGSLDIVVVNWNTGPLLRECIASIGATTPPGLLGSVIVVDNASRDGSEDDLPGGGLPLIAVRNGDNRGFAAACNQGARLGSAPFILFLNPDTRLLPESLSAPLQLLQDPAAVDIGIVGVQLVDGNGALRQTCVRFPTPRMMIGWSVGLDVPPYFVPLDEHRQSRDVDQVIGAFFLVRRALFRELDGFDERFFVYFEELDFSLRARRAGYRSRFLAEAKAVHHEHGSSGQVRAKRLFYLVASRLRYARKHFSAPAAGAVAAASLTVEPLARIARALLRGSMREAAETIEAWGTLWRSLWHEVRREHRR